MPRQSDDNEKEVIGYETQYNRTVTRTEQLPELFKELGLSKHAFLLGRLLNAMQDNNSLRPSPGRLFNLTDICQRISGPSFESWFRLQPLYSVYNLKLLKHFAFLLTQRKIVTLPERNLNLRPN